MVVAGVPILVGRLVPEIMRLVDHNCSPSAPVSQIFGCDLRRVLVSSL
jgi:hypothetical protein